MIFVDTSALLAVLDADDEYHQVAKEEWERLILADERMLCTNYVLVESIALIQRRLGMDAVRRFSKDILPVLSIEWLHPELHARSLSALLVAGRKSLSLVDCASFDSMRTLGIQAAFTFDHHFSQQGFSAQPQ
jgi:predicted nucleic acid-binding protein